MSESINNLLSKYLNQYQKNPRSRVFAPLAETYRKIGMIDDALQTIRDGIKFHPKYQLAYLVLGNCYFDMQEFDKAYDVLKPMVQNNGDNIKLHKLFAEVCEKLRNEEEALASYKTVLFINPYDSEIAEKVSELEESEVMKSKFEIKKDSPETAKDLKGAEEDWVAIDLSLNEKEEAPEAAEVSEEEQLDNWAMSKDNLTNEEVKAEPKVREPTAEDGIEAIISGEDEPFVTHTLVDIYIAQKHYPKAQELLVKILENDPSDQKSRKKLDKVMAKLGDHTETYYKRLERKYLEFLDKIKDRAEIYTRA